MLQATSTTSFHEGDTVKLATWIRLKFIGGPLDGFAENISADCVDLPLVVAIPLNELAGRQFGIEWKTDERAAIYKLHQGDKATHYRFHALRRTVQPVTRSEETPAA